ncbi:MAG TPA: hypothetical protein VEL76_00990 [Gemmataceae bacterium]|nr:hypothetical protein [Gemmataceae bacterium]
MRRRWLANLIGAVLGVAVPLGALTAATGEEHRALGLMAAPFAWTRLLVVHLLATLPLCLLAAAVLGRASRGAAWGWGLLGVLAAGLTVAAGASLAGGLGLRQAGFTWAALVRCLWCLALQLPWCLMGRCLADGHAPAAVCGLRWPRLVLAAVIAVAPPVLYARHLIEVQSQRAAEWLRADRLVAAQGLIEGLCDLGSSRPLFGRSPAEMLSELRQKIRQYSAATAVRLPERAPVRIRIDVARMLRALGRPVEAERRLTGIPETNVAAVLLRADLLQDLERWEESSRDYRRALALLAGLRPRDPRETAWGIEERVAAYNGLASNARERWAYAEAEAVYREGLEKVPEAQAHFHFQLGRLYQNGRPVEALRHLETAVRLEPVTYTEQARPLIDKIKRQTPGCLVRSRRP